MRQETVENYRPQGTTEEIALQYPFTAPDHSFITDGNEVNILPDSLAAFREQADAILCARSLPDLAARVPVVAYGANINPTRFSEKMAAYGQSSNDPLLQVVPMLNVTIPDTQVVWHGKPGQAGSAFAELYNGPESEGKTATCKVQFLTNEQIAMLHATEGITYHFAPTEVVAASGEKFEALAYVAGESTILLKEGLPVTVARPEASRKPGSMTAREAVSYMLQHGGASIGLSNPEGLLAANMSASLAEKKARQAAVAQALGEKGLARQFSFGGSGTHFGRADFNAIHTIGHTPRYLHLAEETLVRLRPVQTDESSVRESGIVEGGIVPPRPVPNKADIMEAIRFRATQELAERMKE